MIVDEETKVIGKDDVYIDSEMDVIVIYGVRYAGSLFRDMAFLPIGSQYEILDRDQTVALKVLKRAE